MKRNNFIGCLLLLTLTFATCKKEDSVNNKPTPEIDSEIVSKVIVWLDAEKSATLKEEKRAKIQLLKESLSFKQLWYEESINEEKFVVIPINQNFLSDNNKGKSPKNYLLIVLDNTGRIRKGNIVQYISNSVANISLETNSFYKIYNYRQLQNNATFSFLSITDYLTYEIVFKNGTPYSFSYTQQKDKVSTGGKEIAKTELMCWDVFWVTYYPNGTSYWEYLYSYCGDEECQETRILAGRGSIINCGGGSGGGEYELEVIRSVDWTVTPNPTGGTGEIKSTETFKGKRNSNHPQGGYFTSMNHNSSICNFCSSSEPNNVWWETSTSYSASAQTATSSVTGNLNYDGQQYHGLTNTKSWSFEQLFP